MTENVTHRFAHQQLSAVLTRRVGWFFPDGAVTHAHWCPACESFHDFAVEQPFKTNGAQWGFDGDVNVPTFTPSMNIRIGPYPSEAGEPGRMEVCHYFLSKGHLLFLGDCTHALAGQTVALPPLPAAKMLDWERL